MARQKPSEKSEVRVGYRPTRLGSNLEEYLEQAPAAAQGIDETEGGFKLPNLGGLGRRIEGIKRSLWPNNLSEIQGKISARKQENAALRARKAGLATLQKRTGVK